MSSSLWTVVLLMALLLPLSEMASVSQMFRQNDNRVFIFQIPLQQLDPKISPRIPDSTGIPSIATEDSYLVALRESQINRNKVPAVAAVGQHHHHHHEKGHHHVEAHHHDVVQDANKQLKGQHHHSAQVPGTYGYVSTTRPLTAMEKNYLRPHKPQLYKKDAVPNSHIGEFHHQSEEDEETSEEVMETSASNKVATLATRSLSSVSDVNSIYSTYSSNPSRFVANKPPSIRKSFEITETAAVKASENGSEKPQENRKPIKKTLQIRVPEMVSVMTNRAANVVRNGMKTVGSTIGIPVRNSLVGKVNSLLPIVAALNVGRKKRSIPDQEAKGWKDNIHKSSLRTLGYMDFLAKLMNKPWQSAATNINKFSSAGKRPPWLQFTRSTSRPVDSIRNGVTSNKAHSVVKRSTNLKMRNFRATALKRVIPWFHSAFSRNKNKRKESQVTQADGIADKGNFVEENEVNVERLMYSPSVPQTSELIGENETRMEQNVEMNVLLGDKDKTSSTLMSELKGDELETVEKYPHGPVIIVLPPEEVPDSDETHKDAHSHEAVIPPEYENDANHDEDDVFKYTHGHGIIVENPLEVSNPAGDSSNENANGESNNIENNNVSPVIASSPGDQYIATGIFGDEVDSELDDLGSLMADIVIAPLPVEAVVAEESVTEPSLDPFDAVIIESADQANKPSSVVSAGPTIGLPAPSNLAHIFISDSSTNSQTSSSSSSSSGSISSSGGITGSTISAASFDPFASLYTFGLAAIGIFVLSLPIWVPFVATRMKRRRNKFIRNRSQSDFSSFYTNIMEFNPYSILMRNLMPSNSEEPFSDPGPLKSEEIYGPATSNRRWRRR